MHATGRRPTRVIVRAGTVKLDDGGGVRTALQVGDEPLVILSPAALSRLLGALRNSYNDVIAECTPAGGQLGHRIRTR